MCSYDRKFRVRTLATMLFGSRLPLCLRCCLLLCCLALFSLEVVLLAILNRITANPQSGPEDQCLGVAVMNCIWFKSLDCGYIWASLHTTLLFQHISSHSSGHTLLSTATQCIYCYTQPRTHCSNDKQNAD